MCCNMAKFKVPSWLNSQSGASSASADSERKKLNRRSFSGFSHRVKTSEASPLRKDMEVSCDTKPEATRETATSTSRITTLSQLIASETEKLEQYLVSNGHALPGLDIAAAGSFPKLPAEEHERRQRIINATQELQDLVRGPRENVRWAVWGVSLVFSNQVGTEANATVLGYADASNHQQLWAG